MLLVTAFLVVTMILTYSIRYDNAKYMTYKTIDNLFILALHGVVLRRYLTTAFTFITIMRKSFYYEW